MAEDLSQSKKRKAARSDEKSDSKRRKDSNKSFHGENDNELVAGKIKRIFMKNFMCHDAMEVNLNERINFIVGANGSGKSAILTALTVGLGARAKDTSRGASIKSFIKKGKNNALIEITITNDGPMAYKYEVYGNSITISRAIGTSSTYKIKNWRGEIISNKKDEVVNIVSFLNIQVDNPISVLNQDVSRTFLVASGPPEKYKLFMKATRLDIIGKNYREASQTSEVAKERLDKAQEFLSENESEINRLEQKLEVLESLDQLKQNHKDLEKELHWAAVIQEEKEMLQIDKQIQEENGSIEKLKDIEITKAAKEQEIDSDIEKMKKEMVDIEAKGSESIGKLEEIKKTFLEAKVKHDEKKEKVRTIHTYIKRKENDIAMLQNEIKKLQTESDSMHQKRKEKTEEINKYEQDLDEIDATLRTKQTDLMHLEENQRRIEQEENKFKINTEEKRNELSKLKRRLSEFRKEPNDELTIYGPNMPRLLKRIEEEYSKGKFKQKPLGPLGSFIKLKDSTWIPAVENHLGAGTLTSFCVDNNQDARILNIIIQEIFRHAQPPQIITSKFIFKVHNVSDGCTRSAKYMNLLDAMEISHPVIANSLIDQREVECVLLIPTSEEACVVMSDPEKVPRNCRRAITKQADLFFHLPTYRTYGGTIRKPKFLQVSTSDAIQSLQEEVNAMEIEYMNAQKSYKDIIQKMENNRKELQQVKHLVMSLKQKQIQLKTKIDVAREVLDSCNNNTVNEFMSEVEQLQTLIVAKKEEESSLLEDLRQSQKCLETFSAEKNHLRDLADNVDAKLNSIKAHIKSLKEEKKRLNISNQGASRRMEEAKQKLQKLNGQFQQQERVVNSKIEQAEKYCPRIQTNRTIDEIKSQLRELKVTIENVEKEHGTKEALLKELKEKKNKYAEVRKFAIALTRSNNKQRERLQNRRKFYVKMKKEISARVQESFENILLLRDYSGCIKFDHETKQLFLEVCPRNDAKRPTKDAKALSGGERSYSTIAFILALWDCTGLPFYFLDEFDVFMDKINRRIIIDILLAHAQNNPQCQFAFLTPLDTSHVVADNSITIHKLQPPERSS